VTWGNGFGDFDNDGDRDLLIVCGHVDDNLHLRGGDDTTAFQVRNLLLRNDNEQFVNISAQCGDGLLPEHASRGMVLGDLDNDGDLDAVILNSRTETTVLENASPRDKHWIELTLWGVQANRGGIGARVTVAAGSLVQTDEVRCGRGYQSDFGPRLHFGLGEHKRIDSITIRWPGGEEQVLKDVAADQILTVVQGRLVLSQN
jgi:hypothetical protein